MKITGKLKPRGDPSCFDIAYGDTVLFDGEDGEDPVTLKITGWLGSVIWVQFPDGTERAVDLHRLKATEETHAKKRAAYEASKPGGQPR